MNIVYWSRKDCKKQIWNYLQKLESLESNDFVAAVDDSCEHIDGGDFLIEAFEFFAYGIAFCSLFSCLNFRNQDRLKVKMRSFVILELNVFLLVIRSWYIKWIRCNMIWMDNNRKGMKWGTRFSKVKHWLGYAYSNNMKWRSIADRAHALFE